MRGGGDALPQTLVATTCACAGGRAMWRCCRALIVPMISPMSHMKDEIDPTASVRVGRLRAVSGREPDPPVGEPDDHAEHLLEHDGSAADDVRATASGVRRAARVDRT